jgi:iron-sulfur cluster assembly protein
MTTHVALGTPDTIGEASGEVVTLSSTALARVRMLIERERRPAGAGLRLSVSDGGCSGLRYVLALENEPQPEDLTYEVEGVRVFVDRKSAPYLNGMQLDFVDGLHGAGFKFLNPNADRTCGCGSSFSV